MFLLYAGRRPACHAPIERTFNGMISKLEREVTNFEAFEKDRAGECAV